MNIIFPNAYICLPLSFNMSHSPKIYYLFIYPHIYLSPTETENLINIVLFWLSIYTLPFLKY
jgi:hypothetical protein